MLIRKWVSMKYLGKKQVNELNKRTNKLNNFF